MFKCKRNAGKDGVPLTSHGFGKTTIRSTPTDINIAKQFAETISRVPGIFRAHAVKSKSDASVFILFQFDHMDKYVNLKRVPARAEDLLVDFEGINADPPVPGHRIDVDATEFWIIEATYP